LQRQKSNCFQIRGADFRRAAAAVDAIMIAPMLLSNKQNLLQLDLLEPLSEDETLRLLGISCSKSDAAASCKATPTWCAQVCVHFGRLQVNNAMLVTVKHTQLPLAEIALGQCPLQVRYAEHEVSSMMPVQCKSLNCCIGSLKNRAPCAIFPLLSVSRDVFHNLCSKDAVKKALHSINISFAC
jgi:hypothetical protein